MSGRFCPRAVEAGSRLSRWPEVGTSSVRPSSVTEISPEPVQCQAQHRVVRATWLPGHGDLRSGGSGVRPGCLGVAADVVGEPGEDGDGFLLGEVRRGDFEGVLAPAFRWRRPSRRPGAAPRLSAGYRSVSVWVGSERCHQRQRLAPGFRSRTSGGLAEVALLGDEHGVRTCGRCRRCCAASRPRRGDRRTGTALRSRAGRGRHLRSLSTGQGLARACHHVRADMMRALSGQGPAVVP